MKTIFYPLFISASLFACSSSSSEQTSNETEAEAKTEATAQQTSKSIENYIALKDALVKSDAAVAKTTATTLSQSMKAESMNASLIVAADLIASIDDLKLQRAEFKTITDGLIASLKANGSDDGVFVQYCPMAFNNTGANWLSMSEEIRNPYYGDMMLKCGRVSEKL